MENGLFTSKKSFKYRILMAFELLSVKIELFDPPPDARAKLQTLSLTPYYADKLHWIKIFTTLQRYVLEHEFRSFEGPQST